MKGLICIGVAVACVSLMIGNYVIINGIVTAFRTRESVPPNPG